MVRRLTAGLRPPDDLTPDGPGFVTLSVVDAAGHSDIVKVFLQ